MNLDKIKDCIKEFASNNQLNLFDVSYLKSSSILEVLFDNDLSLEEIEIISTKLSDYLDNYEDEFNDNYFLDVSTVGVERPIRNEEELINAVGSYIYVKCKDKEYYGDLKKYHDGILNLDVKEKNKTKNVSLEFSKIKQMRYAVKF